MARVETSRYGQTSLHVFSHAIDYHATTAYTPHGLLGIKGISFKHANVLQEKTYICYNLNVRNFEKCTKDVLWDKKAKFTFWLFWSSVLSYWSFTSFSY